MSIQQSINRALALAGTITQLPDVLSRQKASNIKTDVKIKSKKLQKERSKVYINGQEYNIKELGPKLQETIRGVNKNE